MIKKTLFTISALAALSITASATTVTLSAGLSGPFLQDSGLERVEGGLLILGTMTDADRATLSPTSTVEEINAVFQEFGTNMTGANGRLNSSTTNVGPTAGSFDTQQIYIWAFNDLTKESSDEQGLFTVADPDSPGGAPWRYPANAGGVGDSVSITMADLRDGGDQEGLPGSITDRNLTLVPIIPEPSGMMLLGVAASALFFRRRR